MCSHTSTLTSRNLSNQTRAAMTAREEVGRRESDEAEPFAVSIRLKVEVNR